VQKNNCREGGKKTRSPGKYDVDIGTSWLTLPCKNRQSRFKNEHAPTGMALDARDRHIPQLVYRLTTGTFVGQEASTARLIKSAKQTFRESTCANVCSDAGDQHSCLVANQGFFQRNARKGLRAKVLVVGPRSDPSGTIKRRSEHRFPRLQVLFGVTCRPSPKPCSTLEHAIRPGLNHNMKDGEVNQGEQED